MKSGFVRSLLFLGIASQASMELAQSAGTFTPTGNMTTRRFLHTATLLANGKVLIAGGEDGSGQPAATAELYDPATATFTDTANMTTGRSEHTATLLPDGRVLIVGGSDLDSAEIYNPAMGTFTATGKMSTPRTSHAAALLHDGRVMIAGGTHWDGQTSNILTAEIYDPSTGIFTRTGDTHNPWPGPTATLLVDGSVLVAQVGPEGEVYVSSTGAFTSKGAESVQDMFNRTATLLMDGTVLLAGGGNTDPGIILAGAERYDPSIGSFSVLSEMILTRLRHTATLLPDGTVLIAGGASYLGYNRVPLNWQAYLSSVELYNPATRDFTDIGYMTEGRFGHTATLLTNGRVLITGGIGAPGYSYLATAEIYSNPVFAPAPVLLATSDDGKGQGAILHANTPQVVSAENPASVGEAVEIYMRGLVDESVIPPQVAIGGRLAEILFFGNAPGYPGFDQVNVRVPSGVAAGSEVPVTLTYLGRPSNEVTIGVR